MLGGGEEMHGYSLMAGGKTKRSSLSQRNKGRFSRGHGAPSAKSTSTFAKGNS